MINAARLEMGREPIVWWSLAAAFVFMLALVLAANLFADAVRERYLGVIEGRCTSGINGAEWSTRAVATFEAHGHDRREALRRMLELYAVHMDSNEPVHTWPLP